MISLRWGASTVACQSEAISVTAIVSHLSRQVIQNADASCAIVWHMFSSL